MRNVLVTIAPFILLLLLPACKKEKQSVSESKLAFTYNAKQYVLTYTGEGVQQWGVWNNGLYIDRPDIFNGRLDFVRPGCAYIQRSGDYVAMDSSCEPVYADGETVDYKTVYYYKSGSLTINYSNCVVKSGIDFITGNNYSYSICDGTGTFNLELQNKNKQTISITNGIINIYNQKR